VPSDSSNVDAATIRSLTFEKKNILKLLPDLIFILMK
jgi:hypothetical protein